MSSDGERWNPLLEAAVDVGYRQRAWLETDSELESLWSHPRYRALPDRL